MADAPGQTTDAARPEVVRRLSHPSRYA